MADDKELETRQVSARLYDADVEECQRRAGRLPWTLWLREFLHEQLAATRRRKKIL